MLKHYAGFEPKSLKGMIDLVTNLQKLQNADLEAALYGEGNFDLVEGKRAFRVTKTTWKKMTQTEQEKHVKRQEKAKKDCNLSGWHIGDGRC